MQLTFSSTLCSHNFHFIVFCDSFCLMCAGNLEDSKIYLNKFIGLAHIVTPIEWLSCGGDEFLVGRAGYLEGVLWLRAKLGVKVCLEGENQSIKKLSDHFIKLKSYQSKFPRGFQFAKKCFLHILSVCQFIIIDKSSMFKKNQMSSKHQIVKSNQCIEKSRSYQTSKTSSKASFGSDGCVTCV